MSGYWKEYNNEFGWQDMIMALAQDDLSKVEFIEKVNHRYALYELSRLKKKSEIENRIIKDSR